MKRSLKTLVLVFVIQAVSSNVAFAQIGQSTLPMDRAYTGPLVMPDFKGRDKNYSNYRTRITKGMQKGPNFAGHYTIIVIGCGLGCRFAFVGDVATGRVHPFPHGGEEHFMMILDYSVTSNEVAVRWETPHGCLQENIVWDGANFTSKAFRWIAPRKECPFELTTDPESPLYKLTPRSKR